MEPPTGTTLFPASLFPFLVVAAATASSSPVEYLLQQIVLRLYEDPLARRFRTDPMYPWSWQDELLLYNNLVYVPDDDSLRLEIVRSPLIPLPNILVLERRTNWFLAMTISPACGSSLFP
jgi:hypothetical protein